MRGPSTEAALFCRAPRPGGRYRVNLMPDAEPTDRGIRYRRGENASLLEWARVERALAAEVGEPEGVRTIVFDLLIEDDETEGRLRILRLDADPGHDAMQLARLVARGLGVRRKVASIKCLAGDGIPARWYPDLEGFEEDALAELRQALGLDGSEG